MKRGIERYHREGNDEGREKDGCLESDLLVFVGFFR
jgi:hypothetical protein